MLPLSLRLRITEQAWVYDDQGRIELPDQFLDDIRSRQPDDYRNGWSISSNGTCQSFQSAWIVLLQLVQKVLIAGSVDSKIAPAASFHCFKLQLFRSVPNSCSRL